MSELEIRPLRADEIDRFVSLSYYAFAGRTPDERVGDFVRRIRPERNVLVAVEDDEIVSQVMIYEFGVWIDGVRYSAGGLANVATIPEKARRGFAKHLLRASLAWMRQELDISVSTLYPTVYPLYHGLGWAPAGEAVRYVGPPTAFRPSALLPEEHGGRIERRLARIEDVELLEPVYRAFARPRSGYLDRPRWYWEDNVLRFRRSAPPRWLTLWYSPDDQLAGYLLYTLDGHPLGETSDAQLSIYELISLRPEGYRALLTFLSAHHLWRRVVLECGRDVPVPALVENPHLFEVQVPVSGRFLFRVVDLEKALGSRSGVPPSQAVDLALQVRDDAAPWNDGTWRVGWRTDRWVCERAPGRTPDASVDIATLSALFCGSIDVRQAIDIGALRATTDVRDGLRCLFTTVYPPHSRDHF